MIESLTTMLQEALAAGSFAVYLLVFAGGVVASFMPCTYPVLPLTIGYVGNAAEGNRLKALGLSLTLVVGMALVYAVVGMIFAALGLQFGSLAGNGLFMTAVALFFLLMGLFLLDVFTFATPRFMQKLQGGKRREGYAGAFLTGAVSGLVVGPCTGPVLLVVLVAVTTTLNQADGNLAYAMAVLSGGAKLFLFGFGQGALIVLCGVSTSLLSRLPKAGQWMVTTKKVFGGLVILGACLLLLHVGATTGFNPLGRFQVFAEREIAGTDVPADEPPAPAPVEGGSRFGGDEFLE